MSTNCIRCVTNKRTGVDLICDQCRDLKEFHQEDWRAVSVYQDGSGKAGEYYDDAIKTIEEREAVHRMQRAFILQHAPTLAGLYWKVGYLEAEIELHHGLYRGQKAGPADIALLWPGTTWKRVKEKYSSEMRYDWETVIDGFKLIIVSAETEKPQPKLRDGAVIKLPSRSSGNGAIPAHASESRPQMTVAG